MNKEYEAFCRDNEGVAENLLESLIALADKFEKEIIPGEPEKSDALYMLDVYKSAIELFQKVEDPVFSRIQSEGTNFDEENSFKELDGMRECISLLLKLGREKLIDKNEICFQSTAGQKLIQGSYCDEIILEDSGKHYYSLSSKAEKTIKSKSLLSRLREENAIAIMPNSLILPADKWTNLYVQRIEFLRRYYSEKKLGAEYILFTLDNEKEMVFGCELNDSIDISYTFAGVFDEKMDDHIEKLKGLADSGVIDHIVVAVDSMQMADILKDHGIDSNHSSCFSIERI